ncbi:MAG: hypothetical protein LBT01_08710 [Spirochaetaceae bacterium]|jgi:cytoskeletal protein RodZ|nr:hypothetical protein [Spirochaetaceae bacterium]
MWKKNLVIMAFILGIGSLLWLVYTYAPNGKDFLTLLLNASGFAGAAAVMGIFYTKGEKQKKETEVIKHEPESISSAKGIQKILEDIVKEAVAPFKRYKFTKYILSIDPTREEIAEAYKFDKQYGISGSEESLTKKYREASTYSEKLLEEFYEKNGGKDNFIKSYHRGLKLPPNVWILSYRKIGTYSKKGKAVFVKEEFRQSDNVFSITVWCTKNHSAPL